MFLMQYRAQTMAMHPAVDWLYTALGALQSLEQHLLMKGLQLGMPHPEAFAQVIGLVLFACLLHREQFMITSSQNPYYIHRL